MAEAHKRAYRHPKYKTSYRIKNWPEYEKSLRKRGDITIWLSQDAIDTWTPPKNGKRGGQPIYSVIAIETSLILRLVFHLPLRQAEGFLKSILKLMELYLPCPDHTTVSRRNRTLNVCRCIRSLPEGPVHFIVDSTGLKIYGQGEWHSKKHGKRWRKRWMKLHIGVDENGRILASKVTDGHEHDPSQVPYLLIQVNREIERFVGDRIYDQEVVYEAVDHHSPGAEVIVPPRKDAVLSNNSISIPSQRDRHIADIQSKGWPEWKRQSGYYLQSHAENAFY
ncbi:MAG: IS5 family transposase [Candidatus Aminicenantaceae bacterium]